MFLTIKGLYVVFLLLSLWQVLLKVWQGVVREFG
jgi:hypothetical protein